MRRILILFVAAAMVAAFAPEPALAAEKHPGHKFLRSVTNTAFGWTSYYPEVRDRGGWGLVTGTSNTIVRTTVGVAELGTFFLPNPNSEGLTYDRVMEPTHPWESSIHQGKHR